MCILLGQKIMKRDNDGEVVLSPSTLTRSEIDLKFRCIGQKNSSDHATKI
jgi:hypothetical protein